MPVFLTESIANRKRRDIKGVEEYHFDASLICAKTMKEALHAAIRNSIQINHYRDGWENHEAKATEISKEQLLKLAEQAS